MMMSPKLFKKIDILLHLVFLSAVVLLGVTGSQSLAVLLMVTIVVRFVVAFFRCPSCRAKVGYSIFKGKFIHPGHCLSCGFVQGEERKVVFGVINRDPSLHAMSYFYLLFKLVFAVFVSGVVLTLLYKAVLPLKSDNEIETKIHRTIERFVACSDEGSISPCKDIIVPESLKSDHEVLMYNESIRDQLGKIEKVEQVGKPIVIDGKNRIQKVIMLEKTVKYSKKTVVEEYRLACNFVTGDCAIISLQFKNVF